ncbi:MAG: aminopeptidase P family protein [candidate division Zixibacteria bacterium]|nr:aminopeptidase P family protein [candidate division Zixibacteria bacterium]
MLLPQQCKERMGRFADRCRVMGLDLAVVASTKHIAYLTGFLRPDVGVGDMKTTLLLVYPDRGSVLLNSNMFKALAEKTYSDEMVVYTDYDIRGKMVTHIEDALTVLRERLSRETAPRRLGVESRYTPLAVADLLRAMYPSAPMSDISDEILHLRRIKDDDEMALIRESEVQIALGYKTVKEAIAEGATELDALLAGTAALTRRAGSATFFYGDFVSGERSLDMGGPPTPRVLKNGDLFIFDLWTTTCGYWADTCRTFVVGGNPTPDQIRLHDTVMRAVDAGEKRLRPGNRARDVYQAMYDAIAAAGYEGRFPHHGGHGIGLHAHETPFFIPGSDDILEEGMTATLEPGVYVPGIGGVRSEDNYLITTTGPENLTPYPRGL